MPIGTREKSKYLAKVYVEMPKFEGKRLFKIKTPKVKFSNEITMFYYFLPNMAPQKSQELTCFLPELPQTKNEKGMVIKKEQTQQRNAEVFPRSILKQPSKRERVMGNFHLENSFQRFDSTKRNRNPETDCITSTAKPSADRLCRLPRETQV